MTGVLDMLAVTGMIAVSLAVTVPLTGALVRLRANFNPKSIQLDEEGNVEPHTGPIVTSFLGMLARVKRIEVSNTTVVKQCPRADQGSASGMGWTIQRTQ